MRQGLPQGATPVRTVFAGLNGESFGAKEWGVARLRHGPFFDRTGTMDHPADAFGDAGAALGALMLAITQHVLVHGKKAPPAIVWSSSDLADRGCAYLDLVQ